MLPTRMMKRIAGLISFFMLLMLGNAAMQRRRCR
jgi:hypothetical protein